MGGREKGSDGMTAPSSRYVTVSFCMEDKSHDEFSLKAAPSCGRTHWTSNPIRLLNIPPNTSAVVEIQLLKLVKSALRRKRC